MSITASKKTVTKHIITIEVTSETDFQILKQVFGHDQTIADFLAETYYRDKKKVSALLRKIFNDLYM